MKNLRGLFAFVLLLCAAPCFAAVDAFLKIDGVKGESTDASHKDWIEISTFSWGMNNPSATSISAGAGHVAQGCATGEIHFGMRGAAIVPMQKLVLIGAHLQGVTLEVNGQRHVLEGAMLTSCQVGGHGAGDVVPTANCVMHFQRCATHAATLTQPNGQILLGNNSETLTIIAVREAGPNNVTVSARGASPTLRLHCATGAHYPAVTLNCRKAGGTQTEYLRFKMTDVLISSYQVNGDGTVSIGMKYAMADGSARAFQDLR
jgi:type VI protein secretion system component Hcp